MNDKENEGLKKQLEYCYCNRTDCSSRIKDSKVYDSLVQKTEMQQKEFLNYLEDEKDRLARECSNIYEDSLGHTRLVNEDIFDEINDVLKKYKEIIEENKKIEKIKILIDDINTEYVANDKGEKLSYSKSDLMFADRINELIDELNKLKGEK